MFSVLGFLILLVAVAGSSLMVALLGWMLHRINRLERDGSSHVLPPDIQRFREELEASTEATERLAERVDFLERLLQGDATRQRDRGLEPGTGDGGAEDPG